MAIVLGRSMRRFWNDPSEARCSRTGHLRLEVGPPASLGLSKGERPLKEECAPPFLGNKGRICYLCLQVDAPSILELPVGSEGAVETPT